MGHEYYGASLCVEALEEHQYLERSAGVEIARGLVGKDDCGVVDQRPGYGYALHLSTRHLIALVVEAVAQPHGPQRLDGLLPAPGRRVGRVVHQRQLHVLDGGGLGQQVVVLEHEAYLAVAQCGALVAAHGAHRVPIEVIVAGRRRVEAAEGVEQRALAAARGAHDGDELTLGHHKRHSAQRVHRFGAHAEVAPYIVESDYLFHRLACYGLMRRRRPISSAPGAWA